MVSGISSLRALGFSVLVALGSISGAFSAFSQEEARVLLDPATPLAKDWEHQTFGRATAYDPVVLEGRPAIRAEGQSSASGLYRKVDYALKDFPWLEWSWRVDRLQAKADIRTKAAQDFAAAIFLIFEEPGFIGTRLLILSYVWTNDRLEPEMIVESPYHPRTGRDLVVDNETALLGQWVTRRRNVPDDFRRAFGKEPPERVAIVAIYTDNDQTDEPVTAYYGPILAARK